jgi:Cft2 family RNA processing exonuclease
MIFVEIYKKSGMHLLLNKTHLLIDPLSHQESDAVLISHAHSDHINLRVFDEFTQPIYLSQPTFEILCARAKKEFKQKENIHFLKNDDEIQVDGITIKAVDAGHCIGSLQYKISFNQHIIIYTGDFSLEPRMGMQKGVVIKGKNATLITDSTYADKKYIFPSRMELYRDILEWLKSVFKTSKTAVIFARELGTGQELTDLINESTLNCELWVHPSIYFHNMIHASYYPLGTFQYRRNVFDRSLDDYFSTKKTKPQPRRVHLLPIHMYKRENISQIKEQYGTDALAICTGWALTQRFSIHSFALSSHADYPNIQRYWTESGAREIIYF